MKKNLFALALALTLVGSLAACGANQDPNHNSSTGSNSGTGSSTSGSTAGQVARRYSAAADQDRYGTQSFYEDGHYTAGSNGQVYSSGSSALSRDLTQGARDIVRDTGDVMEDIGQGIGNAARDITGTNANPGTPSWEPDSSAVRY